MIRLLVIFSFFFVLVAYWKEIKKILDLITDFSNAALRDGCIKDFFSWVGWSLIMAFVYKVKNEYHTISVTLFFYLLLILWIISFFGVIDRFSDFYLEYMKAKLEKKDIGRGLLIFLLLLKIALMVFVFNIT